MWNNMYLRMHQKKRNIREPGYCLLIKIMKIISCDLLRMLIMWSLQKESIMEARCKSKLIFSPEYRGLFCCINAVSNENRIYFVNNISQNKKNWYIFQEHPETKTSRSFSGRRYMYLSFWVFLKVFESCSSNLLA